MSTLSPEEIQYQMSHQNEDRAADIVVSISVMLAVAYVSVLLRVVARRMGGAQLKADDWMIMVGLILTTAFAVGCFVCVSLGMGKHAILLTKPTPFAKAVLTTEVLYTPASTSIKFSILLLYRRLFPLQKYLSWISISVAIFLVVFALAQMLSVIIQCTPAPALWDPQAYPNAHCDNYAPALLLFAVVNATTDVFILCIPLPTLWKLHISRTRKLQLIAIFLLGSLVCVVSICRAGYVTEVSLTDPSWDDTNTVILSGVENCAGVLSACLPTMLPIWRHLRGRGNRVSQGYSYRSETPRKAYPPKNLWDSDTMILNSVVPNETVRHSGESFGEAPTTKSNDSSSPIRYPGGIHVMTNLKQSDEPYLPKPPNRYQPRGTSRW